VRWFDAGKGVGAIEGDAGEEIFVHYSSILGETPKALELGETVDFDLHRGPRGLHAERVRRLEP
jgi:CspA family cold shock protein